MLIHIPFMGLVRIHVHPRMQGIQRCMGTILYVYIYSIYVHMYRYTLYYVHGECRQLLIIQTLYTACNRKIVSHAMCYIYKVMYIRMFKVYTHPTHFNEDVSTQGCSTIL